MNAHLLATAVAVGAIAVTAVPADAAPKTMKETYAVSVPVPFPVMEDIPGYNGCWNGEEGVSKNSKQITLPDAGMFKATVAYTGDWDLYLFDAKGTILTAAETTETGNTGPGTERIAWKKGKKGQKVTLVACNWMGLKDATVTYEYTYGR
jgi:hypothetical protein